MCIMGEGKVTSSASPGLVIAPSKAGRLVQALVWASIDVVTCPYRVVCRKSPPLMALSGPRQSRKPCGFGELSRHWHASSIGLAPSRSINYCHPVRLKHLQDTRRCRNFVPDVAFERLKAMGRPAAQFRRAAWTRRPSRGEDPRCRCLRSMIMRGSSWACTETRLAQWLRKRRWKARSVASIMKLRIGDAFVMRSWRCGARISAN